MGADYEVLFVGGEKRQFENAQLTITEGFAQFVWVSRDSKRLDAEWLSSSRIESITLKLG